MRLPRFALADQHAAYDEWGCNCGPAAVAAMLDMTLDEVRPHLGDFERKRYTNPTLMLSVLRSIGRPFQGVGCFWPDHGLARIQWEGPWTEPGVPMRARYRYTHWVGTSLNAAGERGVFDVNALSNGSGWCALADWRLMPTEWAAAVTEWVADSARRKSAILRLVQRGPLGSPGEGGGVEGSSVIRQDKPQIGACRTFIPLAYVNQVSETC